MIHEAVDGIADVLIQHNVSPEVYEEIACVIEGQDPQARAEAASVAACETPRQLMG